MAKIETKISKAQYRALLDRAMNSQPVEQQSSIAAQMGNMMGEESPASVPGMMPSMQQPIQQMMPQVSQPGVPTPDPMQSIAPVPSQLNDRVAQAEQAWMQLKGGLGEQLWNRLFQSSTDTGGTKDPGAFFVTSVAKYLADPNSIKDSRVRQFLEGVVGQPTDSVRPEGAGENPFAQIAMQTLQ